MTLLAKINFTPSRQMLDAQLSDSTDALGRLIACEQLSGKKEALPRLQKTRCRPTPSIAFEFPPLRACMQFIPRKRSMP